MSEPDPNTVAKHLIDLLGGRDSAFQKLDQEYKRLIEAWDQDAQSIGTILRAHLFVEHFLTEYLRAKNPNLGSLDGARLSFAQKLSLVDVDCSEIGDLLPGIRHLNRVRNRIAHSLHADISPDDANVLLTSGLFRAMREASAKGTSRVLSTEPLDVMDDFALHAGNRLQATVSDTSALWAEAIRLAQKEASSSKPD
jgi:hypothetical protein